MSCQYFSISEYGGQQSAQGMSGDNLADDLCAFTLVNERYGCILNLARCIPYSHYRKLGRVIHYVQQGKKGSDIVSNH